MPYTTPSLSGSLADVRTKVLNSLTASFKKRVEELLEACEKSGYIMNPYFGIRSPFDQAKFWRQSRTSEVVHKKIQELKDKKIDFLAYCLEVVGPQETGPHVTNAIPGLSWHQWGQAVDCAWILNGKVEWSTTLKVNGINGYENYANQADTLKLTPGGHWTDFTDWAHVQESSADEPLSIYSLQEVDQKMKEKYGSYDPQK